MQLHDSTSQLRRILFDAQDKDLASVLRSWFCKSFVMFVSSFWKGYIWQIQIYWRHFQLRSRQLRPVAGMGFCIHPRVKATAGCCNVKRTPIIHVTKNTRTQVNLSRWPNGETLLRQAISPSSLQEIGDWREPGYQDRPGWHERLGSDWCLICLIRRGSYMIIQSFHVKRRRFSKVVAWKRQGLLPAEL